MTITSSTTFPLRFNYTTITTTTATTTTAATTTAITLQLQQHQPHYNYNYNYCTTPHYIQESWVRRPLQPLQQLQPLFGPSVDSLCHPCITTTHLSYSVLSLKLPPPPCAVLLVLCHISYLILNDTHTHTDISFNTWFGYQPVAQNPFQRHAACVEWKQQWPLLHVCKSALHTETGYINYFLPLLLNWLSEVLQGLCGEKLSTPYLADHWSSRNLSVNARHL